MQQISNPPSIPKNFRRAMDLGHRDRLLDVVWHMEVYHLFYLCVVVPVLIDHPWHVHDLLLGDADRHLRRCEAVSRRFGKWGEGLFGDRLIGLICEPVLSGFSITIIDIYRHQVWVQP